MIVRAVFVHRAHDGERALGLLVADLHRQAAARRHQRLCRIKLVQKALVADHLIVLVKLRRGGDIVVIAELQEAVDDAERERNFPFPLGQAADDLRPHGGEIFPVRIHQPLGRGRQAGGKLQLPLRLRAQKEREVPKAAR